MKLVQYIKDSYNELVNKVSWPTRSQLLNSAIVVLVASLIFAVIIVAMDQASEFVMSSIYKILY